MSYIVGKLWSISTNIWTSFALKIIILASILSWKWRFFKKYQIYKGNFRFLNTKKSISLLIQSFPNIFFSGKNGQAKFCTLAHHIYIYHRPLTVWWGKVGQATFWIFKFDQKMSLNWSFTTVICGLRMRHRRKVMK